MVYISLTVGLVWYWEI